jgi:transcriptional regulator with XRE-family HTH domain
MVNKCDQKEIAKRVGVTPEYLSEVKNGRAVPSFQFFNFLKTIALNGKRTFEIASPDIQMDSNNKVASMRNFEVK